MMNRNVRNATVFFTVFAAFFLTALALEFDVGDEEGWAVPKGNDKLQYNHWAAKNRFQIGDTIRFTYNKDSVMEVMEEEYDRCHSPHPAFFSNVGDTVFMLNRSGTFYFISGVTGHCERGQRMIVRVLSSLGADAPAAASGTPALPANQTGKGATETAAPHSGVAAVAGLSAAGILAALIGSLPYLLPH